MNQLAGNYLIRMTENIYQRIDLAQEQLEVALELFLSNRSYVSALTLAGAAEEIFGKALFFRGEETYLQWAHNTITPTMMLLREEPYKFKDFCDKKNKTRNAAKHIRNEFETEITCNLEEEAVDMLVRACENYARLGLSKTDQISKFENWFYENYI